MELSTALLNVDKDELRKAVETLQLAKERRANVWIMGNGGSAATSSHFANDLSKMCGIKAFSIPDMMPTVLAFGNDEGWDRMFQRTVDVYLDVDDVIVAISCSGKSLNVVMAARSIQNLIVMTGNEVQDNYLAHMPNRAFLSAGSDEITVQEDVHMAMCHAIARLLRGQ